MICYNFNISGNGKICGDATAKIYERRFSLMRKKFIAGIAAAAVTLSSACVPAMADNVSGRLTVKSENDMIIELPELPSGVEAKEIDISSAEELIALRDNVNADPNYSVNAVFNLTADIDLGGMEWEPIGYNYDYVSDIAGSITDTYPDVYTNAFCGTFNGNGHTISNFTITDPRFKYAGLFGSLNHAVINNLNITGASVLTDTSLKDTEGDVSYTRSTLNVDAIDGVDKADIFALYQDPLTGNVYYNYWLSTELPMSMRAILDNGSEIRVYKSSEASEDAPDPSEEADPSATEAPPPTPGPDEELVTDIYTVSCDSTESAGILCGYANNAQFNGCSVTGSIDVYSDSTTKWSTVLDTSCNVGMLCGTGTQLLLNDVTTDGTIKAEAPFKTAVGGVVGNLINGSELLGSAFFRCVSDVDIEMNSLGSSYAGGILGRCNHNNSYDSLMDSCEYTDGSVINMNVDWYQDTDYAAADTGITYIASAGGICGRSDAVLRNCRVGDAAVNVESAYGAAAGGLCGFNIAKISDCTSNAVVNVNALNSYGWAGGICGNNGIEYASIPAPSNIDNVIENCTYERQAGAASVSLQSQNLGCIGYISGGNRAPGEIRGCTANAENMSFYSPKSMYAGGICGYAYGGKISQCTANGAISSGSRSSVYCGGILGSTRGHTYTQYIDDTNTEAAEHKVGVDVSDCINNMDIAVGGTSMYAGGLVGYLNSSEIYDDHQSSLKTSFSTGDIYIAPGSTSFAGGAVGYLVDSSVDDCYSTGSVTVADTSKLTYAGGFVARIKQSSVATTDVLAKVTNCYCSGTVTVGEQAAKVYAGGFTYELSDNSGQLGTAGSDKEPTAPLLNSCYYYSDAEPAENAVGTRLTSAEITDSSKYKDWSFGTDWNVQGGGRHQNIWYIDAEGAHLAFEKPCAYACTAETENGVDARITSISLAYPQSITSMKVITTDITGATAEIPVELPAERLPLFMNIPCDIELSALTASYKIVTECGIIPAEASLTLGDTADAKVKNNTEKAVEAYVAEYSRLGQLIGVHKITVDAGAEQTYSGTVGSDTESVSLFVWTPGMTPLTEAINKTVQ